MSIMPHPSDNTTPFSQWEIEQDEYALAQECGCDDDLFLDLILPADTSLEDQLVIETLLDQGFAWAEALSLVCLRTRVIEQPELQELPNMRFAQWLYQHGQISETLK
jgi:hypothetical protein